MAKKASISKAKYDATHMKPYYFKFHIVNDADIIDKLNNVDSRQGYIRDLIRQDLARTCSVPGSSVPVSTCQASIDILTEKAK
jgi:hypothetical protein